MEFRVIKKYDPDIKINNYCLFFIENKIRNTNIIYVSLFLYKVYGFKINPYLTELEENFNVKVLRDYDSNKIEYFFNSLKDGEQATNWLNSILILHTLNKE